MERKDVNWALRREVRPWLEAAGFTRFVARTAWRQRADRIEAVHYRAPFNEREANLRQISPHSFEVIVGVFLPDVSPDAPEVKRQNGQWLPKVGQWDFCQRLVNDPGQPAFVGQWLWVVAGGREELRGVMASVRQALAEQAEPWFDGLGSREDILARLLVDEPPSPRREWLTGYVALKLGNMALAEKRLRPLLDATDFAHAARQLEADLATIEAWLA